MRLASSDFPHLGILTYDLADLPQTLPADWSKYVLGMLKVAAEDGLLTLPDGAPNPGPSSAPAQHLHIMNGGEQLPEASAKQNLQLPLLSGFDLLVGGDLPIANGLSSSHALMVLCGLVLSELYAAPWQGEEGLKRLALAAQRCENRYIGVQSGIMDGFVIALGHPGEAMLLHCDSLEYKHIPMSLGDTQLWIIDSGVSRELSASAYNQRYAECQEALGCLNLAGRNYHNLAEVDPDLCPGWSAAIADPILRRRARHVISENRRTLAAAEALSSGDLQKLGALMNASHLSLQKDYEVTGEALDTLFELFSAEKACRGSRMTGAGFGGCYIALLEAREAEGILRRVQAGYKQRMGLDCEAFQLIIINY